RGWGVAWCGGKRRGGLAVFPCPGGGAGGARVAGPASSTSPPSSPAIGIEDRKHRSRASWFSMVVLRGGRSSVLEDDADLASLAAGRQLVGLRGFLKRQAVGADEFGMDTPA